ncbi:hypothetical protein VO63_36985 [Streptomyces showdoensis]|uniref:Uncharacterized protein n=1 Tax=Streptomyces showdoensis TaxID=68268 RepID=A0A2P2GBZ3_STREW|nr:hypothetical protein VO63_36985 [Streptomyces showdoensis]
MPLPQPLFVAALPAPTPLTLLPQMLIGASTGTWTTLPDPTPGECEALPWAEEPEPPSSP